MFVVLFVWIYCFVKESQFSFDTYTRLDICYKCSIEEKWGNFTLSLFMQGNIETRITIIKHHRYISKMFIHQITIFK